MFTRSTFSRRPSRPSLVTTAFVALVTVLASALVWVTAPAAQAAGITVTTTADDTITDGACSLREAVANASGDAATYPDCPAGTGEDTITFNLGGPATIPVSQPPQVTDSDMTTIDGAGIVTLEDVSSDGLLQEQGSATMLTLDGLTLARSSSVEGHPGVLGQGGLMVVRDSTFVGFASVGGVGGAISASGSLVVSGATFINNQAPGGGGAIGVSGTGPSSISNSTFFGNRATSTNGGAIRASVPVDLSFNTFVSNSASAAGGAVFGPATLMGNVFQGNTSGSGMACANGVLDAGFNVSDETSCATAPSSLASTNAQLDPAGLTNNGGPTATIALQPGSPAIDLVPVSSGVCPATDQRGVTRPVDGDNNGTAACDAGAYEAPRPPDTTAPVVTVPANITVPATGPTGATVTYTATANDDRDGPLTPTCTPASGSTFPVGTTTVTCTATDAAGNTGTGTFTVTVTPVVANKADLKITLTGPATTVPNATITVTATVLNQGPATAVNPATVIAASGLTTTSTNPPTGSGSITINGTTITGARWTTTQLAAGASVTYSLTGKVTATKGKTIALVAGTLATTPDPQLATNITAKTIKVQ